MGNRHHIIVCVSGWAGSGKDEFCREIVAQGAIHTALADPGKRHCMDTYGFTYDQLWGPSSSRNKGDYRYPKPIVKELGIDPEFIIDAYGKSPKLFLSPRETLQEYMELMNKLYADTWIRKGVDIQRELAKGGRNYSKQYGVEVWAIDRPEPEEFITCFSDFRHIHEHKFVKENGPKDGYVPILVRIKRPGIESPPFAHRSETEQTKIRDAAYDFVVDNDGTIDDLHIAAQNVVRKVREKSWTGKPWSNQNVVDKEGDRYVPLCSKKSWSVISRMV